MYFYSSVELVVSLDFVVAFFALRIHVRGVSRGFFASDVSCKIEPSEPAIVFQTII